VRADLPAGTVTFLFTDIEGSTRLLAELGAELYAAALAEHRRALREAFARHGGVEVDTQGDAFFYAFADPERAVAAAGAGQEALDGGPIRVRMGVHTGSALLTGEGYVGEDVHVGARIAAAGHGGQVVLSGATRVLLAGEVTELGEHRLKDVAAPLALFQLGSARFPPLKTISNTNLPRPASSFVGRAREVAEVVALLREGRLVSLTGPGGSGKTRLALEAAAVLVGEFKAGVFWVGLATIRDPELVKETIALNLGAGEDLAAWIGDRELLLLLDNLEQVIGAAPELATLVEQCPNLHLLVTSRERLRVRGERDYPVLPLADADAVELFCARGRSEADEPVARLCRRLDNLPLALELAAARTAVLSPRQILDRLSTRLDLLQGGRDGDARQQTLRATIDWSHELLAGGEKRSFARLAVFRGGATVEAAAEIAEADVDVLQSLVDKSLLRHSGERFWMLETIRDYAGERLDASGEGRVMRRRHADHYRALAENAYPHLLGNPERWLERLDAEHDNLRAALDSDEGAAETQNALQLAGALYRFWYMRGHLREARTRIERLLAADGRPTAYRARALDGAAAMLLNTGSAADARERSLAALALHRELGDEWGIAYSVFSLGLAASEESDWAGALAFFEESLERFRALGDEHYALIAADGVAWMSGELGDGERRRSGHEQVLRDARAQGDWALVASQLDQLAQFARDEGRFDEALAMLAEALGRKRELGMPSLIVESLCRFAETLARCGRAQSAARLLAAGQALRDEIGGGFGWVDDVHAATLARLGGEVDRAALAADLEQGRRLTPDEAIALALREAALRSSDAGAPGS
jgi:predicted ATPase